MAVNGETGLRISSSIHAKNGYALRMGTDKPWLTRSEPYRRAGSAFAGIEKELERLVKLCDMTQRNKAYHTVISGRPMLLAIAATHRYVFSDTISFVLNVLPAAFATSG